MPTAAAAAISEGRGEVWGVLGMKIDKFVRPRNETVTRRPLGRRGAVNERRVSMRVFSMNDLGCDKCRKRTCT